MSCDQAAFLLNAETTWTGEGAPGASADDDLDYTVGELATDLGITPRALRFYESKGLLAPARHEGMRLYRKADRERLLLILKAKKFGFTLVEIREMIAAQDGQSSGQSLTLSLAKCAEQISLLERQRDDVDAALDELRRIHDALDQRKADR
jgi:DNA-binding transcriptional MerR regulator